MKIINSVIITSICISSLLYLQSYAAQESPQKEKMTLDEALNFAYAHRSSIQELMFANKSQRNTMLAALSGYLPQISVVSRFLSAKDKALPKNQQYITIDQLLIDPAGPIQQYRIEKIGSTIQELKELLHRDEVRYEVETTFFNLYLLQSRIAPVSAADIAAKAFLQKTLVSQEQGLLNSYLFAKDIADYNYAMSAIFGYEEQTTRAVTNVTKAVEREEPFIIDMTDARQKVKETLDTITNLSYNETFFITAAHTLRKDLAAQEQEIIRLEKLKQLRERSYLPTASLYAVLETGQPALAVGLRQLPGNFWQAGIQFAWNFDGLGNVHKAAAEEANVQSALCAKRAQELTIDQEVSNAYHELLELKKDLDANTTDQTPEELFLLQKKRYELGDLSETDYKRALYDWENAQFNIRNLEIKTVLKYKELLFKSGYPDSDNPSTLSRQL